MIIIKYMDNIMTYFQTRLLQWGLLYVILLASVSLGRAVEVRRPTRKVTSKSALKYLTQSLSSMEDFKTNILRPIVRERVPGTAGNKEVQEHIKSLMIGLGWYVEEDTFTDTTPYGEKEFTNIIATFDPSKPKQVVIACHHDSKYFVNGAFVAAMDSAVPCAVMLDTVRQLKCLLDKGPKNKSSGTDLSLQLVFFDGEEAFKQWTGTDSLYGSRHLAQLWETSHSPGHADTRLQQIREFILLDLIGPTETRFMQQFESTSGLYKKLVDTEKALRQLNFLSPGHTGTIFADQVAWGHIEDDHVPFLNRGVDILHLISSPFPAVWHKLTDDWEHLDFDLVDNFSRIFRVFVAELLFLQPEYSACRKKLKEEL